MSRLDRSFVPPPSGPRKTAPENVRMQSNRGASRGLYELSGQIAAAATQISRVIWIESAVFRPARLWLRLRNTQAGALVASSEFSGAGRSPTRIHDGQEQSGGTSRECGRAGRRPGCYRLKDNRHLSRRTFRFSARPPPGRFPHVSRGRVRGPLFGPALAPDGPHNRPWTQADLSRIPVKLSDRSLRLPAGLARVLGAPAGALVPVPARTMHFRAGFRLTPD